MKTGDARMPTTTALQARLQLFQPTQRPTTRAGGWITTAWGRCKVTGRLGQRHADALEAVLYKAERKRATDDGSLELLVDPAKVRRCMSDAGYSGQRLEKLLTELRTVAVEIRDTRALAGVPWVIGGLLDHVEPSPATRRDPLTGATRNLWRVRLGKPLAILLDHDWLLAYNPAPVARLRHGISQAIVRHVLTHRTTPCGGWKLDALIAAVGGPTYGKALRERRAEARTDAVAMAACGVLMDDDRVTQAPSTGPESPSTGPIAPSTGPARRPSARR